MPADRRPDIDYVMELHRIKYEAAPAFIMHDEPLVIEKSESIYSNRILYSLLAMLFPIFLIKRELTQKDIKFGQFRNDNEQFKMQYQR